MFRDTAGEQVTWFNWGTDQPDNRYPRRGGIGDFYNLVYCFLSEIRINNKIPMDKIGVHWAILNHDSSIHREKCASFGQISTIKIKINIELYFF